MSLGEYSNSSNKSTESEGQEPKKFNVPISKPYYLSGDCALKTVSERLPPIDCKINKKVRPEVSVPESEESLKSWLKPGLSLPKLHSRNMGRLDAGEPIVKFVTKPFPEEVPSEAKMISGRHEDLNTMSLSAYNMPKSYSGQQDVNVIGPSKCHSAFEIPLTELNFRNLIIPEEKFEESHALQNWKMWLKKRKHMQDYLKKKLNRNECELVLNLEENFRRSVEDKELLSFHQELKYKKDNFKKESRNFRGKGKVTDSSSPKSKMLNLTRISTPLPIKSEKNLVCNVREVPAFKAMKKQICHFEKEKCRMNFRIPETDSLAVIGKAVSSKQTTVEEEVHSVYDENLPVIRITEPEDGVGSSEKERKSVFWLDIDGLENKYEFDGQFSEGRLNDGESSLTWNVSFGRNAVDALIERTLNVENKGTIAVRYEWVPKIPEARQSLNSIQPIQHEPWFFFNKNSGIFVPGQKYELKFYHHTKKAGVRVETWCLRMFPPIRPNGQIAKLVLTAVATTDYFCSKIISVANYLERRVGESIAKWLMEKIIRASVRPEHGLTHIEYRCFLSEKELFEHHNQKYYYHPDIVLTLKTLFDEIIDKKQTEWDFSFESLINIIRTHVKEKKEKEILLREISNNAKKLLRPSYVKYRSVEMRETIRILVYQVLCAMANNIESDHDYFKKCLFEGYTTKLCENTDEENKREETEEGEEVVKEEEEKGEEKVSSKVSYSTVQEMQSTGFIRFQMLVYLKVYNRLCQAVEQIAGIIETRRALSSWKKQKRRVYKCKNASLIYE